MTGLTYRGDYLRPAFRNASVADVMTPGLITCAPDSPLELVAELMATHGVHAVAVGGITGGRLVWGVIDSIDLVRALRDPLPAGPAHAFSHRPADPIDAVAPLSQAVRLMDERNLAHLVVVDGDRPVGLLSTLDVAGAVTWGRR